MPTFRYKAYDAAGKAVSGSIEADSARQVAAQLKAMGLLLREASPDDGAAAAPGFSFKKGVGASELSLFTRRLSTLVSASLPLYEAMCSLHEQQQDGPLRQALARVRDRIAEGAALSRALAAEPAIFSESYASMVAAGEAGGALNVVLDRLADFLEEQQQVQSRVATALTYPLLMVAVGGAVMLFLLTVVIPKITAIFEQSKGSLPLMTVVLIKLSQLLKGWWWIPAGLSAGFLPLYRRAMRSDALRLKRDRLLLRIPVAGDMLQQLLLSRFARVLGLLLTSGVPIIRSLEITSEVLVNRVFRCCLLEVIDDVAGGGMLSGSLRKSRLFPAMLVDLAAVGEKGGSLEEMLLKAGLAYEREFSARLARLMGLLEPLLVLGMGVAVGAVVMAVLLPIFQMNELMK